jgi:hypothetical protein
MPRSKKITAEKGKKHSKSLFMPKGRKIEENNEYLINQIQISNLYHSLGCS